MQQKEKRNISFNCKYCGKSHSGMRGLKAHYKKDPSHNPVSKIVSRTGKKVKRRKSTTKAYTHNQMQFCPCCGISLIPFNAAMQLVGH